MSKAGYTIASGTTVGLSPATAKSVIGVAAAASFGVDLTEFAVSFDGTSASAVPVLVELCYATFATNAPGTNSTSLTVRQTYGRVITPGFTAARNWTTEPTVLTPVGNWTLTPNGGLVIRSFPLAQTPDSAVSEGYVIRCTAPATVNVQAEMSFERC